ncbi:retrovirus-related pol polyprotein from transposon TNT 1-94 [Tanacetum coccineum]
MSTSGKSFCHNKHKNDLRKFKGKDIVDNAAQVSNATTIAPGMYKLDPVTLAPKDKNNRETHIYYLKTRYVRDTCPDIHKPSEKLLMSRLSKKKIVRSSGSTKSRRSKSTDNTKNDRILQISSSTQKIGITKVLFTLVGNACPLTRITATNKVPLREPINLDVTEQEYVVTKVYTRRPKFLDTVKFGNDQIAKIMRYGDYQIGNIKISRVYYVEGLGHNLFSVGQLCNSDLEVAFRKHTFFVRNLEGVNLLSGSQETNLYTLSIGDTMTSSPICKSKKQSHKPKSEDTNQEKLYLLHMDLCGPMHVASVNRKKYILVIVDDYSRFTWVKFLASKDEDPDLIIKFLKMIQVRLNATVRNIRTDNETEFVNQTLQDYYEQVGISHEISVMRTPQQNGVVERQNGTLVEVTRTMLIFAHAPLFIWAEAIATACYTQNRSIIRRRHRKTPYELLHNKKPDLSYLQVFGELCYPNNDSENLGKFQAKADIGLVPNPIPQQPCIPPPRDDWDRLFQPMFDEYFNPPTIAASLVPIANAPRAVDLADSPVST